MQAAYSIAKNLCLLPHHLARGVMHIGTPDHEAAAYAAYTQKLTKIDRRLEALMRDTLPSPKREVTLPLGLVARIGIAGARVLGAVIHFSIQSVHSLRLGRAILFTGCFVLAIALEMIQNPPHALLALLGRAYNVAVFTPNLLFKIGGFKPLPTWRNDRFTELFYFLRCYQIGYVAMLQAASARPFVEARAEYIHIARWITQNSPSATDSIETICEHIKREKVPLDDELFELLQTLMGHYPSAAGRFKLTAIPLFDILVETPERVAQLSFNSIRQLLALPIAHTNPTDPKRLALFCALVKRLLSSSEQYYSNLSAKQFAAGCFCEVAAERSGGQMHASPAKGLAEQIERQLVSGEKEPDATYFHEMQKIWKTIPNP